MARRVLADLTAEILFRLGNRTDLTTTQRGFFLQDAYLRVAKAYDHVELEGEGTESLLITSDVLTPSSITDLWWPTQVKDNTNGYLIDPEDKDVIDSYTKVASPPRKYYWYRSRFVFDSLSAATITIGLKYKKKPVAITVSSVLDEIYDILIILKAAKIGFETVRDWPSAQVMAGLYKEYEITNGLMPTEKEQLNDHHQGIRVRHR